jgi:hypothetical protein
MRLDWEKYRSDFRRFTEGFMGGLNRFVKTERVEFIESVSSAYQGATVFYIDPQTNKVKSIDIFTFADRLPQTVDESLSKLFVAVHSEWWCYRPEHSRRVIVYNNDAMTYDLKIVVSEIPWNWAEVDRPVKVEVWRGHGGRKVLVYKDEISVFDIFDFVISVFTLARL